MMNTEIIFQRNNNPPLQGAGDRKKWGPVTMPGLVEGGGSPLGDIKEEEEAVRIAVRDKRGRRKSWHSKLTSLPAKPKEKLSKAERKRRQGVVGTTEEGEEGDDGDELNTPLSPLSPLGFDRHKRRSWWNIFIPDDFAAASKSRRASTDIGRTSYHPIHTRSKSHSVDHGTTTPIDLDLLRSKMDRRFNSVGDSDGDAEKERKPSAPPIKTIPYTVQEYDTLNSVAARFDSTPSELRKLNRLASNLIFPGNTLLVPDKSPHAEGEYGGDGEKSLTTSEDGTDSTVEEREILDSLRPVSPKPGYVERVARRPDPREARFLKINVRHITDGQGVVGGVLLVTPNAVMFDPNVSDPLVIEHGPESYGVIAPMEFVVNAAIYHDIAHMRVGQSGAAHSGPQPEIYHTKPSGEEPTSSNLLLVKEPGQCKLSSDEENESNSSYPGPAPPPPLPETTEAEPEVSEIARLQERRASSLDQHWAVPKQKKHSDSLDSQPESDSMQLGETASGVEDADVPARAEDRLTKLSCHDSGIDIRESEVIPPTRKARSDADILLAGKDECVLLVDMPRPRSHEDKDEKEEKCVKEDKDEKPSEGNKTKMLKRLSYPLSWMEGSLVSESKDEKDSLPSLPTSADSQHSSVFSKVFSSSPKTLVSDIGSGIVDLGSGIGSGIVDIGSGIGSGIVDIGSGIGSGIVDIGSGIGSGIVDIGSGIGSGIVDIGSGIGSGLSDLSSNLFLMKTPSEDSGGGKSPGTRSPLTPKFPPQPPNTPAIPAFPTHGDTAARREAALGRSSVGTFMRSSTSTSSEHEGRLPPRTVTPKLDYRSMVSVDDMPDLFASIDKLIPRPARACDDPPLYLRLRMGKPLNKKIPKSTPIMSYGKKKMRPEYWFSVPRNRVDELYHFLHVWVPHLYGELHEGDVTARGFELVESDTELWDEENVEEDGCGTGEDDPNDLSRPSWEMVKAPYVKLYTILKAQTGSGDAGAVNDEVLSMSEEFRRALYASSVGSLDLDLFIPDLVGVTEILTEDHRRQLSRHLPARAEGYLWTLVFSTSQHGFSLNSLYRKMTRVESPILLVVQDTDNNVFGAITSCSLKVSDYFYGTGESLLFRFNPVFNVYQWTGDNMYFIKGNNESLAIGAGDGKFGLWLDGDLYQGRSERCSTYGNEPLSSQEDFVVKTLECWAFL